MKDDSGIVTAENADENNSDAVMNSQELAQSSCSLLATALADLNDDMTSFSYHHPQASCLIDRKNLRTS